MTDGRLDAAPPGGSSLGKGIEDFFTSIRQNISGDAKGAGEAAAARAKAGGGDDAKVQAERTRAFEATSSAGSLESRGHKAVAKSHGEAMRSLGLQLRAGQKSVRHAKRSGDKQLTTQRAAALTRLASMRKMRADMLRDTANQAAKAVRGGAKTALSFYSDSAKRLSETLRRAADRGPAALMDTVKQSASPVTTAIAEGQKTQSTRLGQVAQSAGRSVGRLSESVPVDGRNAALDFGTTMREVGRSLSTQVGDAASSHSKHFGDVVRGVTQTTQSFTRPLPVMFKDAIDDTRKNLDPIYDGEKAAMQKQEKTVLESNDGMVKDPHAQLEERLRAAINKRNDELNGRATKMRGAWGMIMLDENALMEGARGVTWRGGNSIRSKFMGNLDAKLWDEYQATVGGLDEDEYNAIKYYLAGLTELGATFELKTTVHWYGNEGKRATEVMDGIGREARNKLVKRDDWKELAGEIKGGLRGTDAKVFDALEQDREVLAKAHRSMDSVDSALRKNDMKALITAATPYRGEEIVNGKVVSAEEQLAEFQREFSVATGKAKNPNEISQEAAAAEFARYATRDVTVMVVTGHGETTDVEERTYKLTTPEKLLIASLAAKGPNDKETKAAQMLYESERSGKPNLEALENAVIDPRLNPALTPNLTQEQRDMARKEQDALFLTYAKLAKDNGVKVEGETPEELRKYVAGRLSSHYGGSEEERVGARYASSIVTKDRPDAVAAMRYAMEPSGTDVGLLRRTFGRMSREEIKQLAVDYQKETGKNLYAELGVYGHSGGEVSGDERLEIERLMMGVPLTDIEKAEVALYQNLQQQDETGVAGKRALRGSIEEQRLLAAEKDLRRLVGNDVVKDEFGRPIIRNTAGAFNDKGRYQGRDDTEFLLAVSRASYTAESYAAAIDRLASVITTIIAVVGAVVAAVLTVVTGGLAGPLMIAALSFGLASMGANALIRGGRYGWEEALTDLGMVGVQVLTAGLGAQLGAAAKVANTASVAARTGGAAVAKTGLTKLFTGNPIVDQIMIGAITGGVGGVGQTALQAETWRNGLMDGIGNTLLGGVRGSLAGAATSAATNAMEAMPVSRGAFAAMRAGRDYRSLGSEVSRLSAGGGGVLRNTLSVGGRAVARGGLQAVGGAAGKATELAFDTATGKYHGSLTDALGQIGEASLHSGLQGIAEGAGEAFGQRRRDIVHPQEAIDREQHRMKQIADENAAMRGALHADAMQAAQAPPPVPELPAARMPVAAEPTVETPRTAVRPAPHDAEVSGAIARTPIGEEAARMARPTELESEALKLPAVQRAAPHGEVEGAAARLIGTEMELAPKKVITNPEKALESAMNELTGKGGPFAGKVIDEPHPEGGRMLVVRRADGELIEVRVIVGDTKDGNIANFARGARENEFVVTLSDHARESTHARALAHEIEELRYHGTKEAADKDLLQLRPGGVRGDLKLTEEVGIAFGELHKLENKLAAARAESSPNLKQIKKLEGDVAAMLKTAPAELKEALRLSAHDRGRLAELQVLDAQLQQARSAPQRDEARIARLEHESQALVAHLGLVTGAAAPVRRAAVARILAGDGESGRALQSLVDTAVSGAKANPLLRPRPATLDEAATLAAQINRARAMGEHGTADSLMALARKLVRERFGWNVEPNTQKALAIVEGDFKRLITSEDDRKAAMALMNDVVDRESARARAIAADKRLREIPDELRRLQQDARPETLQHLQTAVDTDRRRLDARKPPLVNEAKSKYEEVLRKFMNASDAEKDALRPELSRLYTEKEGAELTPDKATQVEQRLANNERRLEQLKTDAPGIPQRIADLQAEQARMAGVAKNDWAHAQRPYDGSSEAPVRAPVGGEPLDGIDDLRAGRSRDPRTELAEQQLIRQRYGDDPNFQEFDAVVTAYFDRYRDKKGLPLDQRLQEVHRLYADWRRGAYFTGEQMAALEGVRFVSAGKSAEVPELARRQLSLHEADTVEVAALNRPPLDKAVVKRNIDEINTRRGLAKSPPLAAADQEHLQLLLTAPKKSRPPLALEDAENLSVALVKVCKQLQGSLAGAPKDLQPQILERITAVKTAMRDVREALGVAAGRRVAQELFPTQQKMMEGAGAHTADLAFGDADKGPVIVLECKGQEGSAKLGSRLATEEGTGATVRAEQGSREYLRSLAQVMVEEGAATDAGKTGAAIQKGLAGDLKVRYIVVHQEINADGTLGRITLIEYEMSGK
jgi:hypothetical protein